MRNFALFVLLCCISCGKKDSVNINKLTGYWEIQKVELDGEKKKEYKINDNFDYFEVKGNIGTRSRVMPQFDGTFMTNEQPEHFTVSKKDGKTYLNYQTPYSKWNEEVVSIEDSTLVIKNNQNLEFHYKRTGPLNFTDDGKTTK